MSEQEAHALVLQRIRSVGIALKIIAEEEFPKLLRDLEEAPQARSGPRARSTRSSAPRTRRSNRRRYAENSGQRRVERRVVGRS